MHEAEEHTSTRVEAYLRVRGNTDSLSDSLQASALLGNCADKLAALWNETCSFSIVVHTVQCKVEAAVVCFLIPAAGINTSSHSFNSPITFRVIYKKKKEV